MNNPNHQCHAGTIAYRCGAILARFRCWIASKIAPEAFWNEDASREIDQLTVKLEAAREEVRKVREEAGRGSPF